MCSEIYRVDAICLLLCSHAMRLSTSTSRVESLDIMGEVYWLDPLASKLSSSSRGVTTRLGKMSPSYQEGGQFASRIYIQLPIDLACVILDSMTTEVNLCSNLLVALTRKQTDEHLMFLIRKALLKF